MPGHICYILKRVIIITLFFVNLRKDNYTFYLSLDTVGVTKIIYTIWLYIFCEEFILSRNACTVYADPFHT
jgi:hypothetical protein